MKRKLKPVDPATYARFKREKRCFEPDHDRKIEDLSGGIEDKIKLIATLEEALSNLKAEKLQMITIGEAQEAEATAKLNGFREGQKEAEERLRKEKRCFDGFHKFTEGKRMVNMTLIQVMNLFGDMANLPMSTLVNDKVTVLIPDGYSPRGGTTPFDFDKALRAAISFIARKKPFIT